MPGAPARTTGVYSPRDLLAAALAPSSKRSYQHAWKTFISFAQTHERIPFPADQSTIVNFVTYLFNQGRACSSIKSTLSAIGYFHKLSNLPDPTKSYLVSKLLIGASNLRQTEDTRLPILPHTLKKLIGVIESVERDPYTIIMFKAIYLLMFYAFLRISEIAVPNRSKLTDVLKLNDIKLFASNGRLTSMSVKFSNFKHHSGKPITIKIRARNSPLCPVAALANYLHVRGNTPGPLFRTSRNTPLTTYAFSKTFKATLNHSNLDPTLYKAHSFRIGAATSCAQKGVPFDVIRRLGRWKSDAFIHYIRTATYTY